MTTLAPLEYRDRRTGLIVFGILEILLGGVCMLLLGAMLVSVLVFGRASGAAMQMHTALPGMLFYALVGVVFIWLGIGSLLARRWARALWVCLSGVGLAIGVLATPIVVYVTAQADAFRTRPGGPVVPPEVRSIAVAVAIVIMLFVYLLIPGALFLFYRSPHVRRTCEVRDPVERWTDRCPLPVLALSLFSVLGAAGMLPMLAFHGVFPVFGTVVSGLPGDALILVLAALWLYIAWSLYRMRTAGWWLALLTVLVVAASGAVTVLGGDLALLYQRMGLNEQVIAAARNGSLAAVKWVGGVSVVPWVIWLVYVRRYFSGRAPLQEGGET